MKSKTLVEAVSKILGHKVTEGEAMHFAHSHYMELCMFQRYEDKIIALKKEQKAKKEELKKKYSKN